MCRATVNRMNCLPCRRSLLALLFLVSVLLPASAQNTLTVEKIEIRHIGPPAVSDELIRANIRVKIGEPYSPSATDDDIRTLKTTGYFRFVQVRAERTPGGMKLIYVVQGQPTLTDVRLDGNSKVSTKTLMKKVTSKVGEPLDDYKLFKDAQEMQKLYEKKGYAGTKVTVSENINENLGRGTATFDIKESPRVRVIDVQFEGAQAFSQKRLRKVIKTRRWWMFSWLTGSGKLKEEQFDQDKDKLKEFYRSHGYIDFDIKDVKFDYVKPTRLIIKFSVFEGKQYKVGSVQFQGNKIFTDDQIRKGISVLGNLVRPKMLEGSIFTPQGLEQNIEAIEGFYGAHGYIGKGSQKSIDLRAIKNANVQWGTMDLVFQLNEGEKSYIELIEIKGNIKTKDKVVRRELAVAPGEVFDMVRVRLSVERLNGLSYFSKVGTEVEPTEVPNRKNLVVGVEEGQSGNFFFGAGFSSIDKLFGYVGMTQGNFDIFNPPFFTGGGQKLRLQATVGTEQQNYEIIFVEPWFLNRKLALDVNLFARDIGYYSSLYQQKEIGGQVGLSRALWVDSLRAGVSYTLENIDLDFDNVSTNVVRTQGPGRGSTVVVTPPPVSPVLLEQQGSRTVSKVTTFLTYDTRGGGLLPNRGQVTTLTATLAGGPLGFDTDFYKFFLDTAWYFKGPFPGHVLEIGGFAGVVQAYNGAPYVPIFDQFFLGGANNLRGFKFREVGPKDIYGNPIGGNVTWFGSAEYSVPIMERLRLAVFYDMGNVFATVQDVDFSQYSSDFGFGIRLNIPQMGPLRLDYGIPISHPGNPSSGRFQFSVGYTRPF